MSRPRLLVMACSGAKIPQAGGKAPPPYLYDGPGWRTLRAYERAHPNAWLRYDLLALSARYGVVGRSTPLREYDQRMTPERVAELACDLQRARLAQYIVPGLDVLVFGGSLYVDLFSRLWPAGRLYKVAGAGRPRGGIGHQLHDLKQWLEAS